MAAELERALRELRIDWPETPDLARSVHVRIQREPARSPLRARLLRRRTALVASLVLAAGSLALSPDARSAILEFLGLKSVKIERREPVTTPAPAPIGSDLGLGDPSTQARADRLAGFRVRPPTALAAPDAIFFAEGPPDGGRLSYLYGDADGPDVLVTVARASVTPFIEKTAGQGTRVTRFEVDGDPAYFLSGEEHGYALGNEDRGDVVFEPQRLAGTTLLVERGGVLLRVEGDLERARAVEIARSIAATPEP